MTELRGISASPGIALGRVFLYLDDNPPIPRHAIQDDQVGHEFQRFNQAVKQAEEELLALKERSSGDNGVEGLKLLDSHLLMLNDPDFHEKVEEALKLKLINVEWVLLDVMSDLLGKLDNVLDEYLRERSLDLKDVSKRVLNHLLFRERISLADLPEGTVLVGRDLMPSDAMALNNSRVRGIAMDLGARTSHTAILARAFEIPAVLGLSEISRAARNGDEIIIDGTAGLVVLRPDRPAWERYERSRASFREHELTLMGLKALPAATLDGKRVMLNGNIEVPEEVESLKVHGADGIGLYRSEFLFMRPGILPSEELQYKAYSRVLKAMKGKPVTIRTLDLGGDKLIPEYTDSEEKNPLLGWRAIRFCLARKPLFMIQLRALLRSSMHGELKIMFPLVSGVEELEAILSLLDEAKAELRAKGLPFREGIPIGCMIEVPAAAMTTDILAKRAQFFSIGTNDLIQYTIAVDRGNQRTAYLYEPFHPGVLRLIKMVIDNAHAAGIPVGMCGEMAGDPAAALVLLGLGLDEFSMSAAGIPQVKEIIRSTSMREAAEISGRVMAMCSWREIDDYLASVMKGRLNGPV